MPQSISKTQRWLDLLAFLLGHRFPVSVDEIMRGVPGYAGTWESGDSTAQATTRRMFERDKDELRELGIPLETVEYSVGGVPDQGYRLLRKDFYLPYLEIVGSGEEEDGPATGYREITRESRSLAMDVQRMELRPDEAAASLEALLRAEDLPSFPYAAEARSAFRKLAGDLQLDAFRPSPVLHLDPPRAADLDSTLRDLSEALSRRKRVRLVYHGIYRDEETEREVDPYGLVFERGHWYLVGHDHLRSGVRVLRVSRMREVHPNTRAPHTPDYEIPPDFDLDEHLGNAAWELGSPEEGEVEARVAFTFPLSLWAARNGHGELILEDAGDGTQVRGFRVRQTNPFLRWILSLEGDARILAPVALRDALLAMARRVAELHERPSEGEVEGEVEGEDDDG